MPGDVGFGRQVNFFSYWYAYIANYPVPMQFLFLYCRNFIDQILSMRLMLFMLLWSVSLNGLAEDTLVVRKSIPGEGITLPAGFQAVVVADTLGRARHLAVAPNGDI